MKRTFSTLVASIGLFAVVVLFATPAHAAYNSNNIIDDGRFTNHTTMDEAAIQAFLNARNSGLKNYVDPSVNQSAAKIIRDAAWDFGINPQVIMATLQKEQSLMTNPTPSASNINFAMGYGCPTTGSCSFPGFYTQVRNGSWQLRFNMHRAAGNNGTWTGPSGAVWGNSSIAYACRNTTSYYSTGLFPGRQVTFYAHTNGQAYANVTIANAATAAMYCYTPHVYNPSGVPVYYSGSYNFVTFYERWFGPTYITTNWRFEDLDGSAESVSDYSANVGPNVSSITFNNSIHNFYYDVTAGHLRHAKYSSQDGWNFTSLDGVGGLSGRLNARVGQFPKPVAYAGALHVFYYDVTNGDLRHGWSDQAGSNWQFQTLDGTGGINGRVSANVGFKPSVSIIDSRMHVFYYDVTNGDLRHGWFSDNIWRFEVLDGSANSVSRRSADLGSSSATVTYGTTLQVFYHDTSSGNLVHAWDDGVAGWRFENLDGDTSGVSRFSSSLGIDVTAGLFMGTMQLYYYDAQFGNLRHAWFVDGQGWRFENLDGDFNSVSRFSSNLGYWPALVNYSSTNMQLYYYDAQFGNLRHAWFVDGQGWRFENLDGDFNSVSISEGNVGQQTSAVMFEGSLQVFYQDAQNGNLRHAWFP